MVRGKALKDWNNQVAISFDVTTDGRLVARCKNVYLPKPDPKDRVAHHLCRHDVDFLLVHPDNSIELLEVKSSATKTSTWRLKVKLLEATLLQQYPDIKYTIRE